MHRLYLHLNIYTPLALSLNEFIIKECKITAHYGDVRMESPWKPKMVIRGVIIVISYQLFKGSVSKGIVGL